MKKFAINVKWPAVNYEGRCIKEAGEGLLKFGKEPNVKVRVWDDYDEAIEYAAVLQVCMRTPDQATYTVVDYK